MGKINNEIFNKMQEQFNGCPLFIDREKGDLDEYEKVDAKFEELRKNQDSDGYYKFKRELLDKHCGSTSLKEILKGM